MPTITEHTAPPAASRQVPERVVKDTPEAHVYYYELLIYGEDAENDSVIWPLQNVTPSAIFQKSEPPSTPLTGARS